LGAELDSRLLASVKEQPEPECDMREAIPFTSIVENLGYNPTILELWKYVKRAHPQAISTLEMFIGVIRQQYENHEHHAPCFGPVSRDWPSTSASLVTLNDTRFLSPKVIAQYLSEHLLIASSDEVAKSAQDHVALNLYAAGFVIAPFQDFKDTEHSLLDVSSQLSLNTPMPNPAHPNTLIARSDQAVVRHLRLKAKGTLGTEELPVFSGPALSLAKSWTTGVIDPRLDTAVVVSEENKKPRKPWKKRNAENKTSLNHDSLTTGNNTPRLHLLAPTPIATQRLKETMSGSESILGSQPRKSRRSGF